MPRTTTAVALVMLVCSAGVSCKREAAVPAQSATDDVRGQPINSPVTTNAVSSTTTTNNREASPAASPADVRSQESSQDSDGLIAVGFDKLASFTYAMPDDLRGTNQVDGSTSGSQIPGEIRALDKKSVSLKGFMLPLKVEGGLVTEMLIMRDQSMCCYGTVPKINEWVSVKMTAKGVKPIMDQPVTLFGTLHVGEMRENGYLVGIYQMDCNRMAGPM